MNDGTTISKKQPLMLRDAFLVLVAMALFLFALQPREHAHGERRRETDHVADTEAVPAARQWQRYEAEALEAAVVQPAFEASL